MSNNSLFHSVESKFSLVGFATVICFISLFLPFASYNGFFIRIFELSSYTKTFEISCFFCFLATSSIYKLKQNENLSRNSFFICLELFFSFFFGYFGVIAFYKDFATTSESLGGLNLEIGFEFFVFGLLLILLAEIFLIKDLIHYKNTTETKITNVSVQDPFKLYSEKCPSCHQNLIDSGFECQNCRHRRCSKCLPNFQSSCLRCGAKNWQNFQPNTNK